MKKLKTGDVVRVFRNFYFCADEAWCLINKSNQIEISAHSRQEARYFRSLNNIYGERIAKVIKVCPKTVLVEISK